jgi:hypothetical protein
MTTATPLSRISSQMVVSTSSSPPGLQAEGDVVLDRAGDPAVLGDARHRGEAHAGGAADHVQDFRRHVDPGDRRHVVFNRRQVRVPVFAWAL